MEVKLVAHALLLSKVPVNSTVDYTLKHDDATFMQAMLHHVTLLDARMQLLHFQFSQLT